jgi:anti-anti-sigma regulatory factor
MLTNCTIARESEGDQIVYRVTGVVDRASAWALRQTIESESAPAVLLDFSLVRDFSDLGVAVLAHGLIGATRRVLFRGLRQHQVRIFRYCGVAPDDRSWREAARGEPQGAEESV